MDLVLVEDFPMVMEEMEVVHQAPEALVADLKDSVHLLLFTELHLKTEGTEELLQELVEEVMEETVGLLQELEV